MPLRFRKSAALERKPLLNIEPNVSRLDGLDKYEDGTAGTVGGTDTAGLKKKSKFKTESETITIKRKGAHYRGRRKLSKQKIEAQLERSEKSLRGRFSRLSNMFAGASASSNDLYDKSDSVQKGKKSKNWKPPKRKRWFKRLDDKNEVDDDDNDFDFHEEIESETTRTSPGESNSDSDSDVKMIMNESNSLLEMEEDDQKPPEHTQQQHSVPQAENEFHAVLTGENLESASEFALQLQLDSAPLLATKSTAQATPPNSKFNEPHSPSSMVPRGDEEVLEFTDVVGEESEELGQDKVCDRIIGMVITFDPTTKLLETPPEPVCISRSKLRKLQEIEVYVDSLLGRDKEEHSDSSREIDEVLADQEKMDFHINTLVARQLLDSHSNALPSNIAPTDEIEIVFIYEDDDDEEEEEGHSSTSDRYGHQLPSGSFDTYYFGDEAKDEIEIEFLPSNGEEEEEDASKSMLECISFYSGADASTKFDDCRSHHTSSSDGSSSDRVEPPRYEWFLPDHLDVQPSRKSLPFMLNITEDRNCDVRPSSAPAKTGASFFSKACDFLSPKSWGTGNIKKEPFIEFVADDLEANGSSSVVETASVYTDCRSQFTPPIDEGLLSLGRELQLASSREPSTCDCLSVASDATPPYEWFHPDHLDVVMPKRTPYNLLSRMGETQASQPPIESTVTSSSVIDSDCVPAIYHRYDYTDRTDSSTDVSSESIDVMSFGSGTSSAVQNLLELCKV